MSAQTLSPTAKAVTSAPVATTSPAHSRPSIGEAPAGGEEAAYLTMSYAAAKEQSLRRFEKGYVDALMRASDNNISAAARKAGMDRSNFKRVLRKYRSDVEADGPDDVESPQRIAG